MNIKSRVFQELFDIVQFNWRRRRWRMMKPRNEMGNVPFPTFQRWVLSFRNWVMNRNQFFSCGQHKTKSFLMRVMYECLVPQSIREKVMAEKIHDSASSKIFFTQWVCAQNHFRQQIMLDWYMLGMLTWWSKRKNYSQQARTIEHRIINMEMKVIWSLQTDSFMNYDLLNSLN